WDAGGRDIMSGGMGTDTALIQGDSSSEIFIIYDRVRAGQMGITGLAADTEIVITRNGVVIAELNTIEEIVINGGGGEDFFVPIGNFTGTSLNMNTITLIGSEDDDVVDITGLASPHRIVFESNGGNDTVIGSLRSQDVIMLADGTTRNDYSVV